MNLFELHEFLSSNLGKVIRVTWEGGQDMSLFVFNRIPFPPLPSGEFTIVLTEIASIDNEFKEINDDLSWHLTKADAEASAFEIVGDFDMLNRPNTKKESYFLKRQRKIRGIL